MRFSRTIATTACSVLLAQSVMAIDLDLSDTTSIKNAAASVAYEMMSMYPGNLTGGIPGLLGDPYYWWEAGGMFGTMIEYWYYTGDTSYNNVTSQAMLFQVGADDNYEPANQTKSLGNDDQGFWGMAAMTAAEVNFTNPASDEPQWLALAQAVFNSQTTRWDNSTCNGGLRWQIFSFNSGYDYKNTISNGCLFNLASRLYRYTGNSTYADWAVKVWDWTSGVGLISDGYAFYDGTDCDPENCTTVDHIQWTYNAGIWLHGAANMYDATNSSVWANRTQLIWDATDVFFTGNNSQVLYEVACEPGANCDTDQLSFKAYTIRWMAASMKLAPFLADLVFPYIQTTAYAAAETCGGSNGWVCSTVWYNSTTWDGTTGVGQQMSALSAIQSTMINDVGDTLTDDTGGTSVGDPSAGSGTTTDPAAPTSVITTGDRAGAGIVTVLVLGALSSGAVWMVL